MDTFIECFSTLPNKALYDDASHSPVHTPMAAEPTIHEKNKIKQMFGKGAFKGWIKNLDGSGGSQRFWLVTP